MSFIVIKSHAHIGGKVYSRGDEVELSDEEAKYLLSQNVVIGTVDAVLPSEADGILDVLRKENADLKQLIEKQKEMIQRLTAEIEKKNITIAELRAKKK